MLKYIGKNYPRNMSKKIFMKFEFAENENTNNKNDKNGGRCGFRLLK